MRFRKKPVEIEARRTGQDYDEDCAILGWSGARAVGSDDDYPEGVLMVIDTLEGTMEVSSGDWVIQGVADEFYPCKPEIFEQTYEAVSG